MKSRKKFSFEISTNERMFLLFADNEKEKDDWIGAVGKSIVRSSKTFLRDGKRGGGGGGGSKKKVHHRNGVNGGAGTFNHVSVAENGYGYSDDDDDSDSDYGGEGGFENQNNHPYFND